jgi:hypothetical protein
MIETTIEAAEEISSYTFETYTIKLFYWKIVTFKVEEIVLPA